MRGECGDVGIGDPAVLQCAGPDRAARRRVRRRQFQAADLAIACDRPLADDDQEGFQPLHRVREPRCRPRLPGRIGVDQNGEAQQGGLPFHKGQHGEARGRLRGQAVQAQFEQAHARPVGHRGGDAAPSAARRTDQVHRRPRRLGQRRDQRPHQRQVAGCRHRRRRRLQHLAGTRIQIVEAAQGIRHPLVEQDRRQRPAVARTFHQAEAAQRHRRQQRPAHVQRRHVRRQQRLDQVRRGVRHRDAVVDIAVELPEARVERRRERRQQDRLLQRRQAEQARDTIDRRGTAVAQEPPSRGLGVRLGRRDAPAEGADVRVPLQERLVGRPARAAQQPVGAGVADHLLAIAVQPVVGPRRGTQPQDPPFQPQAQRRERQVEPCRLGGSGLGFPVPRTFGGGFGHPLTASAGRWCRRRGCARRSPGRPRRRAGQPAAASAARRPARPAAPARSSRTAPPTARAPRSARRRR